MDEIQTIARLEQLPVIVENMQAVRLQILDAVKECKDMADTAESIVDIRAKRAQLSRWFREAETVRKEIKGQVMAPYEQFEEAYKECIADPIGEADTYMKTRIGEMEGVIKADCEARLRSYFDELKVANHVDWLEFDKVPDFRIDLVSARAKTPTKLMKQLKAYVEGVAADVTSIAQLDNAAEVMAEYRNGHSLAEAITSCKEREWKVVQAAGSLDARKPIVEAEDRTAEVVDALLAPVQEQEPEELIEITFTVTDTKARLIALREWMKANGYQYQ